MWPLSILIIPFSPSSLFCSLFSFLSDRFERSQWFLLSKAKGWQSDRSIRIIPPKGKSIESEELKWPLLYNEFGKGKKFDNSPFLSWRNCYRNKLHACMHNFPLLFIRVNVVFLYWHFYHWKAEKINENFCLDLIIIIQGIDWMSFWVF